MKIWRKQSLIIFFASILAILLVSTPAMAMDASFLLKAKREIFGGAQNHTVQGGGGGYIPASSSGDSSSSSSCTDCEYPKDADFDNITADNATIQYFTVTDSLNVTDAEILGLTITNDQIQGKIPLTKIKKIYNKDIAKKAKIKRSKILGLNKQLNSKLDDTGGTVTGDLNINGGFTIDASSQPENAEAGQIYLNSVDNKLYYYNGTAWIDLTTQGESYTAGSGLTLSGTEFSAKLDGATLQSTASGLSVNSITASKVSDFDTEVTNNVTVAANTAAVAKATLYDDGTASAIPSYGAGSWGEYAFHDEDDMSSDDASGVASQQSVKSYVDSNGGTSGYLDFPATEWDVDHDFLPAGATFDGWTVSNPANFDTLNFTSGELNLAMTGPGAGTKSGSIYKTFTANSPINTWPGYVLTWDMDGSGGSGSGTIGELYVEIRNNDTGYYERLRFACDGGGQDRTRLDINTPNGTASDWGPNNSWATANRNAMSYSPSGGYGYFTDLSSLGNGLKYGGDLAGNTGASRMFDAPYTTYTIKFWFYFHAATGRQLNVIIEDANFSHF